MQMLLRKISSHIARGPAHAADPSFDLPDQNCRGLTKVDGKTNKIERDKKVWRTKIWETKNEDE